MSTCENITDDLSIIDVNGRSHSLARSVANATMQWMTNNLSRNHVSVLLGLGWSFFLLGWVLNLAYYSLHPNMVDTDPSRRLGRLYTRPRGWCGAGQGVLISI